MRPIFYLGFLLLMVFDTLGQIAFKFAGQGALPVTLDQPWVDRVAEQPWTYVIIGCYIAAFFTYMTLLKVADVGPLFAASHLQIVTVTAFSVLFLDEQLSPVQWLGCMAITAGVALLAMTEKAETNQSPPRPGLSSGD